MNQLCKKECKKDFEYKIGDYTRRVTFFTIKKGKKYNCQDEMTWCTKKGIPTPGVRVFDGKEYYSFTTQEFNKHFYTLTELRKLKLKKINKSNFFTSKLLSIFDKLKNNILCVK